MTIRLRREGALAIITIDRPGALNAPAAALHAIDVIDSIDDGFQRHANDGANRGLRERSRIDDLIRIDDVVFHR